MPSELKRPRRHDDMRPELDGWTVVRPVKRVRRAYYLLADNDEHKNIAEQTLRRHRKSTYESFAALCDPKGPAMPLLVAYYLTLPDYPEHDSCYDHRFGDRVTKRYKTLEKLKDLVQVWRVQKYGKDVAQKYPQGDTPDPIRNAVEARRAKKRQWLRECRGVSSDEESDPDYEEPQDLRLTASQFPSETEWG